MTVDEFRESLRVSTAFEIVRDVLLPGPAVHVPDHDVAYIRRQIGASYGVDPAGIEVVITGSAKLGFSLTEKRKKGQSPLPRYRAFSAQSDIDVAVISPIIFDKIWLELSSHYHRSVWFPQDTGRLGDYLVAGWLRPDHFPKHVRLPFCDNWWDTFRKLSSNTRFKRRRLAGGAFQSKEHLSQYLARAVRECISFEVSP